MKELQAPKVATIKMQFGELKLNPWTLNGFQKINTIWIYLKKLSTKLEDKAQIFQQALLNPDIGCKSYSALNWTSRLREDTLSFLGQWGIKDHRQLSLSLQFITKNVFSKSGNTFNLQARRQHIAPLVIEWLPCLYYWFPISIPRLIRKQTWESTTSQKFKPICFTILQILSLELGSLSCTWQLTFLTQTTTPSSFLSHLERALGFEKLTTRTTTPLIFNT